MIFRVGGVFSCEDIGDVSKLPKGLAGKSESTRWGGNKAREREEASLARSDGSGSGSDSERTKSFSSISTHSLRGTLRTRGGGSPGGPGPGPSRGSRSRDEKAWLFSPFVLFFFFFFFSSIEGVEARVSFFFSFVVDLVLCLLLSLPSPQTPPSFPREFRTSVIGCWFLF